jgi:protoporphyrinogen/coproporphyrinogen III oxidase
MKTVMVIGGGITGLSAMYELNKWKKEHSSDVRLILAEGSRELGGKLKTKRDSSFLMEEGADSLVARKVTEMSFIKELGLEKEVVYNTAGRSYIYVDGEIKPIPDDSLFGIPTTVESLAKSTLVSAEGKVEALKDLYVKNETFTKTDSIGSFLECFFGKELVEKQIAPVLSGVYSGNLSDLTIESTIPFVLQYKNEYGSIIKGFEANKEKYQNRGGEKFLSFNNGLKTLIDAYEAKLDGVDIYKNTKVAKIEERDQRYLVTFANGEIVETDYAVLSIPHSEAEKLLADPELEKVFSNFKNSSLISVYVGFDVPDSVLPKDGTGFITADTDELSCNACTWTSRKWEHTSKTRNLLVRLFYKSSHPAFAGLKNLSEEELLKTALSDIEKSLGIAAEPITSQVTNWSDQMPNYLLTHPQSVKNLEDVLQDKYPGLYAAGCSYYGVGVPVCIESGENTAKKIIANL